MGDEESNIKHGLEILYYEVIMQMKGRKGSEITTQKKKVGVQSEMIEFSRTFAILATLISQSDHCRRTKPIRT